MTIINNHSKINLDATFQEKHKELFKIFSDNNLDVEINADFGLLRKTLTSLTKDDYPYNYDPSFDGVSDISTAFALLLKSGDTVISTYAAMKYDCANFINDMKSYFVGAYEDVTIDTGSEWYSSLQWVSKDHRGKKLGMGLDHLKKNIIFDILNGDVNYAIHKESLTNYHSQGLVYDKNVKLATIPDGDVGGAGEKIDKIYNVTWTTKSSWTSKQDDVKKSYS
tara:strand:- start:1258 stop:1926 length:669 start_codon:yes stop_codon:yes gene_type:complete